MSPQLWAQFDIAKKINTPPTPAPTDKNIVLRKVDVQPKFDGNINKFLSQNLTYPQEAIDNGVQGLVKVEFVVTKEGTITNIKIIQGIGAGCDEEAKRVILLTNNKWTPAQLDGESVNATMLLPVKFVLVDE